MLKEFTITNITEMIDAIAEIQKNFSCDGSVEHLWFRGQRDRSWKLVPSIQVKGLSYEEERGLTNDFRMRANRIMDNPPDPKNYSAWMSIMQHYGIPTRMLDWSRSPLIAAFFAVEDFDKYDTDASIWVLRPGALNQIEKKENCIYASDMNTVKALLRGAFTSHLVEDEDDTRKILACYSIESDLRMYSQQSCFTVHGTRDLSLNDDRYHNVVFKMNIPLGSRINFKYPLDVFGITEGYIYPDFEHISSDLKHSYGIH